MSEHMIEDLVEGSTHPISTVTPGRRCGGDPLESWWIGADSAEFDDQFA